MWTRARLAAHLDAWIAGALGVLYVAEILFSGELTHDQGAGVAVAIFFASSFLARRTFPLVPLLAAVAVIEINHTVLHGVAEGGSFMLGLIVALYSGTRYARGWMLPACVVVSVAIIPLAALDPDQPPTLGDWIFFTTFVGFPTIAGRIFFRRNATDERLAREHVALAAERDRRTAEAVAAERARIARELHDVVAHAISVIVLQARGGRKVLATSPGEATAAFDTIEHSGEQALEEMRRLLAMLRYDEGLGLAPQRGLDALDDLADSMTRMGLPVEVVREGQPVTLAAGLDLSAYRIVQEALTNALKHAGPARAQVRVSYAGRPARSGGHRRRTRDRHRWRLGTRPGRDPGAGRALRRSGRGGPLPRGRLCRPRPLPARSDGVIRVLLADDQGLVRSGFRMILGAEDDMEVVGEAADGLEAVELVARLEPDVVLMDIRMPGLDGIEATRRVVQARPELRVVVLTTFDLDEYVYAALRAGASAFLLKDAKESQLLAAIRVVADGGSLFAPGVTARLIARFAEGAARPAVELPPLTAREREVLGLVAQGLSNAEIAQRLVISEHTTKTHVASLLQKLGLRSRVQAVVLAYESGLVRPGG